MPAVGIARDAGLVGGNLALASLGAAGGRSGNQWWWQRCTGRPRPREIRWNGVVSVISVAGNLLADKRANSNISLSLVGDGRVGVVAVVPLRLMPAGTLGMGRDSCAGGGLFTAPPMLDEVSASEKFSEFSTSDSGVIALLLK